MFDRKPSAGPHLLAIVRPLALVAVAFWVSASSGAQTCTPSWPAHLFSSPAFDGWVRTFVQWDPDGPGPAPAVMVAGGNFTTAGGAPAAYIAQGDGVEWSALGAGLSGPVTSLVVFDEDGDGPGLPHLFAAGAFWLAGGQPAQGIARWDGSSWSSIGHLGPLASDTRFVMCVVDDDGPGPDAPALFVGSSAGGSGLTSAGGVPVQGLARWDGTNWSSVPGLAPGLRITALTAFDDATGYPQLVAAGYVPGTGINTTSAVARWTGATWVPYGLVVPGTVWDMAVFDTDGPGPTPPELFIGGSSQIATSLPQLLPLARFHAGSWTSIPIPCSLLGHGCTGYPFVYDLLVFDGDGAGPAPPELVLAGIFNSSPAGGFVASTTDGSTLVPVAANPAAGAGVFEGTPNGAGVRALGSFEPAPGSAPRLFAGGSFGAAEVSCANFAVWTGSRWTSPGNGVDGQVTAMVDFDPDGVGPAPAGLVAGGKFTIDVASGVAPHVAFWDGNAWSSLGAGLNGTPTAFCVFDEDGAGAIPPALFAGGLFTNGGVVTNVARWDGTAWTYSLIAPTPGSTCTSLVPFDDDGPGPNPERLHAAIADSTTFNSGAVFRWTGGTSWLQLGTAPGPVWALSVVDDDGAGPQAPSLCAGGAFTSMSGVAATNSARWNGQGWSAMGSSPGVRAFASFDRDGPGGQPVRLHSVDSGGVAYWDGAGWITAGVTNGPLRAIAVHDPDADGPLPPLLYVGGGFGTIDGVAANCMASWDGVAWAALGSGIPAPPASPGVFAIASSHHRGFPTLFAGGMFAQAGGSNSNDLAAWTVNAGLTLAFSTAAGAGLVVRNDSCRPEASYFDAFSLDATNASQPGSGWWAGLFIDAGTILAEYSVGGPPFLGTLDAAGTSVFPIDAGTQASLAGLTVYAVTRTFDPALFLSLDASNVASHQF